MLKMEWIDLNDRIRKTLLAKEKREKEKLTLPPTANGRKLRYSHRALAFPAI
jgi:hypothetical protein